MTRCRPSVFLLACVLVLAGARALAHDGPPFPIVSQRIAGPYEISVWTDPDATDDGTAGGQFWVMLELADGGEVPPDTRASVMIRPLDRDGPEHSGVAEPVNGDVGNQFVALLMDHEGRFAVRTVVRGSRGEAVVDADVEATYDLRPPPIMLLIYMLPFLLIGLLWLKLLLTRRRAGAPSPT
ncbi:MAG TPA: hypothetical protein VIL35_05090 [Vicinamibacterales bacterium]